MKILVPIKRVVDYMVQIRIKEDQSGIELDNVKMAINPFDAIALEEALQLKEANKADQIIVVTIGPEKAQEQLRTALAMGADKAILVQTDMPIDLGGLEPLGVAKTLKVIIEQEKPDLVIMGKQSIDDDSNQTGQMLAGLLDWPQGTFISKLRSDGNTLTITREIDDGQEILELQTPAILTADLNLNRPRRAKLPDIMKIKNKPIKTIELSSLGIDVTPHLELISVSPPEERKGGIIVKNVEELINNLRNKEEII